MRLDILAAIVTSLIGCAYASGYDVRTIVQQATIYDGRTITVRGVIVRHDLFLNLYSRDRQVCIGLLVSNDLRESLYQYEGETIAVSGRLHAQGCGRDAMCVEHLCGPAVLRDVTKN